MYNRNLGVITKNNKTLLQYSKLKWNHKNSSQKRQEEERGSKIQIGQIKRKDRWGQGSQLLRRQRAGGSVGGQSRQKVSKTASQQIGCV
jgi:hypothetical protein